RIFRAPPRRGVTNRPHIHGRCDFGRVDLVLLPSVRHTSSPRTRSRRRRGACRHWLGSPKRAPPLPPRSKRPPRARPTLTKRFAIPSRYALAAAPNVAAPSVLLTPDKVPNRPLLVVSSPRLAVWLRAEAVGYRRPPVG